MKIDPISHLFSMSQTSIEKTGGQKNISSNWLTEKITETNQKLLAADDALLQLATHHASSLHETMLTMEEAKISFQYLEQIRNRLMTAYQEILKEPV